MFDLVQKQKDFFYFLDNSVFKFKSTIIKLIAQNNCPLYAKILI